LTRRDRKRQELLEMKMKGQGERYRWDCVSNLYPKVVEAIYLLLHISMTISSTCTIVRSEHLHPIHGCLSVSNSKGASPTPSIAIIRTTYLRARRHVV
jgi:hypothetical protein